MYTPAFHFGLPVRLRPALMTRSIRLSVRNRSRRNAPSAESPSTKGATWSEVMSPRTWILSRFPIFRLNAVAVSSRLAAPGHVRTQGLPARVMAMHLGNALPAGLTPSALGIMDRPASTKHRGSRVGGTEIDYDGHRCTPRDHARHTRGQSSY